MSGKTRPPLGRRFLEEFIVVMLGVLAALAVDRWVQTIDSRATEKSYLRSLREDFTENRKIAERLHAQHRSLLDHSSTVLQALGAGQHAEHDFGALAAAVEFSGWNPGQRFVSDTWDDLIATGHASLLRDVELRSALRRFYARTAALEVYEAEWQGYRVRYREVSAELLAPNVRVALGSAFLAGDSIRIQGEAEHLQRALREAPGLGARLTNVLLAAKGGILVSEHLLVATDSILARIEAEIRKPSA